MRLNSESISIKNIKKEIKFDIAVPLAPKEQVEKFNRRNNDENIKGLANELLSYLNPNKPIFKFMQQEIKNGNHQNALKQFRNEFIKNTTKLTWLESIRHVYVANRIMPVGNASSEDLIDNVITNLQGERLLVGEPGSVNWNYGIDYNNNDQYPIVYMLNFNQFYPLMDAYIMTKLPIYMEKWCDFIDSQIMFAPNNLRDAVDLGYNLYAAICGLPVLLASYIQKLTEAFPTENWWINECTLARIVLKMLRDYLPESVLYARSNPQNWQGEISSFLTVSGIIFDDFKLSDFYICESLRAIETYNTHLNLPDGTELQRDLWYNFEWPEAVETILKVLKNRPDMLSESTTTTLLDAQTLRLEFLSKMLLQDGKYPIGLKCDVRNRAISHYGVLKNKLNGKFDNNNIVKTLTELGSGISDKHPEHTSDAFSYGGYYLMRTGWEKEDMYGIFFSGSDKQDGFRIKANNIFGLAGYGCDFIIAGEEGPYDMVPSPISVDGKEQNSEIGVLPFGHRRTYEMVSDKPLPYRNFSSQNLDFVEGIYDGGFTYFNRGTPEVFDDVYKNAIYGVSHHRKVYFIRQYGIWIVTDILKSDEEHNYSQRWSFPIESHLKNYNAFEVNDFYLDEENGMLRTMRSDKPNISMHQITDSVISYSIEKKVLPKEKCNACNILTLNGGFTGSNCKVISIFHPYTFGQEDINVEKVNGGFDITLHDNSKLSYRLNVDKTLLTVGTIKATCEALLLIENENMIYGICEGASENNFAKVVTGDFEFSVVNNKTDITKINYPLLMPEIYPKTKGFANSVTVSIEAEQGTTIYYTTDGSNPNLSSEKYSTPFVVNNDTYIKAIAVRNGIKIIPIGKSLTDVSAVAIAQYQKLNILNASILQNREISYEYFESKSWQQLFIDFAQLNKMIPKKTGVAKTLFDISARETSGYFGFKYNAVLKITKYGVYTINAPYEYYMLNIAEGYELIVIIDDIKWDITWDKQGFGKWDVVLEAGLHSLEIRYVDYRKDKSKVKLCNSIYEINFDKDGKIKGRQRRNFTNVSIDKDIIWSGITPQISITFMGETIDLDAYICNKVF